MLVHAANNVRQFVCYKLAGDSEMKGKQKESKNPKITKKTPAVKV